MLRRREKNRLCVCEVLINDAVIKTRCDYHMNIQKNYHTVNLDYIPSDERKVRCMRLEKESRKLYRFLRRYYYTLRNINNICEVKYRGTLDLSHKNILTLLIDSSH